MNVTLSIDEQTLERARQHAQQRGTSLNQMIRDYLTSLTASDPAQAVAELERLWNEEEGDSGGWAWNREEAYDRPVLR
jgi:CRISPR/Cas system-associated protein Csm6